MASDRYLVAGTAREISDAINRRKVRQIRTEASIEAHTYYILDQITVRAKESVRFKARNCAKHFFVREGVWRELFICAKTLRIRRGKYDNVIPTCMESNYVSAGEAFVQ